MSNETNVTVNNEYKDRLFNFIFGREENREWTLSLYNAVNRSDYMDSSMIQFNTIEDVLYMGMRNDTSFIISDIMSVYEHQSTFNPNMPLRLLGYVGELFSGYISNRKLNKYGSKLMLLPVPKLVVFYNGIADKDDEVILRLTDSFDERHRADADIEVRVRMLNINHGKNKELMDKCKPLAEYAWFIGEIRNYLKSQNMFKSVKMAIEAMPENFVLKGFLRGHLMEVEGMLDREYNEAEIHERFKEEGREEERINTERERKRAEEAEHEAETAKQEAEAIRKDNERNLKRIKELEAMLAAK